jgi:hypothetical protein
LIGWIARCLAILFLAAAGLFFFERNPVVTTWLVDDRNHPDSLFLQKAIQRSETQEKRADLSGFNDGDWRIVCVVGGYRNAAYVFLELAPNDPAAKWWKLIWPWLYAGDVPEYALAVIYVTNGNAVRVRRFISPVGNEEHLKACVMSPNKELIWR